jgi:tellurite resistance protein
MTVEGEREAMDALDVASESEGAERFEEQEIIQLLVNVCTASACHRTRQDGEEKRLLRRHQRNGKARSSPMRALSSVPERQVNQLLRP